MSLRPFNLAALCLLALACSGSQSAAGLTETGLEGVVRRGPIMPVCRDGVPCDAPFSATFEVRDGERIVARFRSDSAGHFLVAVAPGDYLVAPDPFAPPVGFLPQTHAVTVGPDGLTHVELDFDTGIR